MNLESLFCLWACKQHEMIGVDVDNVQQPPLIKIIYLCDSEMFTDEVILLCFIRVIFSHVC